MSGTSGKRSGVAKAVRGSTMVVSKPAIFAIGASAWLIWTAPITTSFGGGRLTVRKNDPSGVVDRAGRAGPEARRELFAQRIVGVTLRLEHEPLVAGRRIGHEDRGRPPRTGIVQAAKNVEIHGA